MCLKQLNQEAVVVLVQELFLLHHSYSDFLILSLQKEEQRACDHPRAGPSMSTEKQHVFNKRRTGLNVFAINEIAGTDERRHRVKADSRRDSNQCADYQEQVLALPFYLDTSAGSDDRDNEYTQYGDPPDEWNVQDVLLSAVCS